MNVRVVDGVMRRNAGSHPRKSTEAPSRRSDLETMFMALCENERDWSELRRRRLTYNGRLGIRLYAALHHVYRSASCNCNGSPDDRGEEMRRNRVGKMPREEQLLLDYVVAAPVSGPEIMGTHHDSCVAFMTTLRSMVAPPPRKVLLRPSSLAMRNRPSMALRYPSLFSGFFTPSAHIRTMTSSVLLA
jgi:hypothetical protein